tara:strand:- start:73 stop:954 length:882 start_codon:yes stop_codon:yes gene_type:complete
MSQALNNLKKLIIEVVEEEVSTNEYANTQAKKRKKRGLEEKLNLFLEKNTPTKPSKWSYYKSQAKKKFDVYPSAYANAWAAKKYKAAGGGWKKEQIGEASMTGNLDGGEGPPQTPYAFQSKKKRSQDKKKEDDISTNSTGFTKVNEVTKQEVNALRNLHKGLEKLQKDYFKIAGVGDKTLRDKQYNKYYETILTSKKEIGKLVNFFRTKQMLGEGRYHDWRNDESITPKQKIGRSMREVRDSLNGLSKTIDMSVKLKTELKVDSKDYWKTTNKALTKISERLVKLAGKVGNLK